MNIVKSYFYLICIFLNSEFMVKIFFCLFSYFCSPWYYEGLLSYILKNCFSLGKKNVGGEKPNLRARY